MKINKYFTLALASLAFAACSNDDEVDGGSSGAIKPGNPTWASFSVVEDGVASSTRVIDGTDVDESGKAATINGGYVYIFSNGKWEQTIPFTGTKTTVTQVTTGSKQFIVLANRDEITCDASTTFESFRQKVVTATSGQDLVTTLQGNGWLLSNAMDAYNAANTAGSFAGPTVNIEEAKIDEVEGEGSNKKNNITVKVSRAVARSKFIANITKATEDGTDSGTEIAEVSNFNMQYSNQALTSYTFLQTSATQVESPFYNEIFATEDDIKAKIEQDGTFGAIPATYTYLPENTYNQPKYGQATNIYFKATYKPLTVVKGYVESGIAGAGVITENIAVRESFIYDDLTGTYFVFKANGDYTLNNNPLASGTEEAAENAVTEIWKAIAKDKGVYDVVKDYGSWSKEAGATLVAGQTTWPTWEEIRDNTADARKKVNPVKAQDGKYYIGHMYKMRKFVNGEARYRIYLADNATDGFKGYKSVIRNYSYDVTLNGITGPGIADGEKYPGGSTEQKPGGGTGEKEDPYQPGKGEPTNPTDPIDPNKATYIKATIDIMPWVKVTQGAVVG